MSNTIGPDAGSDAYQKVMQDLSPGSQASSLDIEADAFQFLVDTNGGTAEHSQATASAMEWIGNAASANASTGALFVPYNMKGPLEAAAAFDQRTTTPSTQQPSPFWTPEPQPEHVQRSQVANAPMT
jgi:hypothetical protein